MDTEQYERSDYFFIELAPPIWAKKMSGAHFSLLISKFQTNARRYLLTSHQDIFRNHFGISSTNAVFFLPIVSLSSEWEPSEFAIVVLCFSYGAYSTVHPP